MAKADAAWTRGKTVHSWIWGIMKKLHHTSDHGRGTILNRIIGDYKKYSLNPSGRTDPTDKNNKDTSADEDVDEDRDPQCESQSQCESLSQPAGDA